MTSTLVARVFAITLFASAAIPVPCAADLPAKVWDRIEIDGHQIGYASTQVTQGSCELRTEEEIHLHFRLGGQLQELRLRTLWVEAEDGRPLRLLRSVRGGVAPLQIEAHVEQRQWVMKITEHGATRHRDRPLPDDVLFPRAMAQRARAVHRSGAIVGNEFDLQKLAFESVSLTAMTTANGASDIDRRWLRTVTSDSRPTDSLVFWHESSQRFIRPMKIAGQTARRTPCPDACNRFDGEAVDVLDGLLRRAPYRIPRDFLGDTLRFALEPRSGIALLIPETDEQDVAVRGARSIVTVCADCGDEPEPDAETLHRYLQPNAWVQSEHPRIVRMARGARAGRGDIAVRMRSLVRAVQEHMDGEIEMAAYADAVTAAESRSGDCTEFAVLLAALARAHGIPTRVVAGMAYSARFTGRKHVFSPHAWVQAWTGERWQSFDAGLGQFDSGHIVLAIGDGQPDDYAGVLSMLSDLDVVDAGRIASEKP